MTPRKEISIAIYSAGAERDRDRGLGDGGGVNWSMYFGERLWAIKQL